MMEVKFEFKTVEKEKYVIMNTPEKKYSFKALERISKNNNPYIGLFVKNGYIGFIEINFNFGKIKLDDINYTFRLKVKSSDYYMYEFKVDQDSLIKKEKNYLRNFKFHEDNIKAEVYSRLKKININCELEYKVPNGRVDIAIKNKDNKVVGLIEVKKRVSKYETVKRSNIVLDQSNRDQYKLTKQFNKYLNTGLPLFILVGYENIPKALAFSKSII